MKKITGPPIRAIIPSTPNIVATNIPPKAKPKVMPMLLREALIAVWLAFRVALITFLVEMFVGIDSAKEASE
jgi:hypothetical protein